MGKNNRWSILAALAISGFEIFFTLVVYHKLISAFEVIVVSLLVFIYLCIAETSQRFEQFRLLVRIALHKQSVTLDKLAGRQVEEEDFELIEDVETHTRESISDLITRIGHFGVAGIVIWKAVKSLFFS